MIDTLLDLSGKIDETTVSVLSRIHRAAIGQQLEMRLGLQQDPAFCGNNWHLGLF